MAFASPQAYWWLIISVLGSALVALLYVQGGQSLLQSIHPDYRAPMCKAMGRKWALTYVVLLAFAAAVFLSPFDSSAWGLWAVVLASFAGQACIYEYSLLSGGSRVCNILLLLNCLIGSLALGVVIGMLFYGGERAWLQPMALTWGALIGLIIFFITRTLACMFFINKVDGENGFIQLMRVMTLTNGLMSALLLLVFAVTLLLRSSFSLDGPLAWWPLAVLVAGLASLFYAIGRTALKGNYFRGFWWGMGGTLLIGIAFFGIAA